MMESWIEAKLMLNMSQVQGLLIMCGTNSSFTHSIKTPHSEKHSKHGIYDIKSEYMNHRENIDINESTMQISLNKTAKYPDYNDN